MKKNIFQSTKKNSLTFKILKNFISLWMHLNKQRKKDAIILLLILILSSILQSLPLYLIKPIINLINGNQLGGNSSQTIFMIIIFTFLIIISGFIKIISIWHGSRVCALVGNDISDQIYKSTLAQPYIVHVNRNSSKIISALSNQLAIVVNNFFRFVQFISSLITASFLFISLLIINFKINFLIFSFIGLIYLIIAKFTKDELRKNSNTISLLLPKQIKEVKEGLASIKEIILTNTRNYFRFNNLKIDRSLRYAKANNIFISNSPRYLVETMGMIVLILSYVVINRFFQEIQIIPVIATIGLGTQKMLPEIQNTYSSWAKFYSVNKTFDIILDLMDQPYQNYNEDIGKESNNISFKELNFNNVSFGYNKEGVYKNIIKNMTFKIYSGERIGIVGPSGTGKSTLANLIMGIYKPKNGDILINNINLYDNNNKNYIDQWRSLISFVHQETYLLDKSIAENIAFGINRDQIKMDKVVEAANKARISKYIESTSNGYFTQVGEEGISLSGGQKQRIAIARSIYRNTEFLLLDEATNALDNSTEKKILDYLYNTKNNQTVVVLAHHISSLKGCSRIIELDFDQNYSIKSAEEYFNEKNVNN